MNAGTTLAKTEKGRLEVARRSGSLTSVQRRLLILVDGMKSVNDLGAYVRAGELAVSLAHLQGLGLIVPTGDEVTLEPPAGPGFTASKPAELARAATSPKEFIVVRSETAQFVRDRLGPSGDPICAAIERCNSPQELRSTLRGIEVFVGQRLDPQTTQEFARHFGALLL